MENILHKTIVSIVYDDVNDVQTILRKSIKLNEKVYSYLIYCRYTNKVLTHWDVEFLISETDSYNTICKHYAIADINDIILTSHRQVSTKYVIGYKQPPLELLIVLFDPLIRKLVHKQQQYWKDLEYDDLYQMCRLVICTLYTKGYYVHKNLIERSFVNEVLMHLRPDKHKPNVVSIDSPMSHCEDGAMSVGDTLTDGVSEEELRQVEDEEADKKLLEEQRNLILELLGSERQYKQLLREYGNKSTTNWSRTTVQRLKKTLAKIGITDQSFKNY